MRQQPEQPSERSDAAGTVLAHGEEGHPSPRRGGPVDRAGRVLAWWQGTRPGRANARFGAAGGSVLTGGIAYTALFSVIAGLTLGWTAVMAVLGGNAALRDSLVRTISRALPGLLDTGDGTGLLSPGDLVLSPGLSVAGVVSVVVLVLTATSATGALRTAVLAMFGASTSGARAVAAKGRELSVTLGMAAVVVVSALLTTATGATVSWVLDAVGKDAQTGLALGIIGRLIAFVLDAVTFVLVVTVLAGQRPPRADLLRGAALAALGIGVLRYLGAAVVAGSAARNPLLASFAVLITLLVWINLNARIVLLAAAWTADPPVRVPDGAGLRTRE